MGWDVVGLGNALMDALVVIEDDHLLQELGLIRGTMHPVDHRAWQRAYEAVHPHEIALESGGSCANAIATVGRLGGRARYCGQVGADDLGEIYAARITEACGGHALQISATEPTGKCLSIISATDAERTMLTDLGAAIRLDELGTFADELRGAKIAHFTGYTLLEQPMRDVVLDALEEARRAETQVSLDAADPFVVVQIRDLLWELMERYASVVFLNADEARGLTGEEPTMAIHTIASHGVDTVVIKLGAEGSLVKHQDEVVHIEVRRVHAVDTTGAGDAYAGGFLYGLSRGWSAVRCARLANAVAALTVAQIGAVVKDGELLAEVRAEFEDDGVGR